MNYKKYSNQIMISLQKINNKIFWEKPKPIKMANPNTSKCDSIKSLLCDTPKYWGKIGTTELLALEYEDRWLKPNWPKKASWERPARRLFFDSGVFPVSKEEFFKFVNTYKQAIQNIDGIYLWQTDSRLRYYESQLISKLCPNAVNLSPWDVSKDIGFKLLGMRWLIVSPFVKTMKSQVINFNLIHNKKESTDKMRELEPDCIFLKCPPLAAFTKPVDKTWHNGLDRLTDSALKLHFDIALVGAGAWSLPLLSNLKKAGKSGVHLGGETQLLFGIKGGRWDRSGIYNQYWVRPSSEETPKNYEKKENGCYW